MSDDNVTRRMGKLLRGGAALLHKACPQCNTPLLRLPDGTLYCAKCDQTVLEQPAGVAAAEKPASGNDALSRLSTALLTCLDALCRMLPEQPQLQDIRTFAGTAKDLVDTLRAIRDLRT
jgi:uncharacterized Zn finger protein (UPF0148 family)